MEIETKKHGTLYIIGEKLEIEQLLYKLGFCEFIDLMCKHERVKKNGKTLLKF
jgi:hypothetical protein